MAGWAGAITKSISLIPLKDKKPRIGHLRYGHKLVTSQNYEMGSVYTIETWVNWVRMLREEFPDRLLYVSLFAGSDPDNWKYLADAFTGTDIQGFECNFSCPHSTINGKGSIIGKNPDLCSTIVEGIKQTVGNDYKIMPKLPYLSHPNEAITAKMCLEAGADAIAGINTIAGLCEIDPYTFMPKLNTGGLTTAGGFSYHLIRPFGRLFISQIARSIDWVRYPISAMGGVSRQLESMVDYLALGANHLQVCTEVMNHGVGVIDTMKRNLVHYLEKTGKTLDEIRGRALPFVTEWDKLDDQNRVAFITESCTGCGECISYCMFDLKS